MGCQHTHKYIKGNSYGKFLELDPLIELMIITLYHENDKLNVTFSIILKINKNNIKALYLKS